MAAQSAPQMIPPGRIGRDDPPGRRVMNLQPVGRPQVNQQPVVGILKVLEPLPDLPHRLQHPSLAMLQLVAQPMPALTELPPAARSVGAARLLLMGLQALGDEDPLCIIDLKKVDLHACSLWCT